jgi:hypothetical protein
VKNISREHTINHTPLPLFTGGSRVLDRFLQFLTLGMGIAALNHSVNLVIFNKMNNHLHLKSLNIKKTMTYKVWNPGPGF